jgi:oxygen-independent coproporphyrinogen-3 oxidase
LDSTIAIAAYIHIPFCRRRCFYCDFPISVVGNTAHGSHSQAIGRYVKVLQDEIRLTPSLGACLKTVFFGGGTPSLLAAPQLRAILETLDQQFGISPEAEISMEVDPGSFSLKELQAYQAAGVNRFSLGVQAFDDELLALCGRSHRRADIQTAVRDLQQASIQNYSIDLISGLPTQTLAQWHSALETAIALQPTHLSTYDLTIETGTVFGKRYRPGERPLPSDETTAEMYRLAHHLLTQAGYEHYEISNYARPGYQCQHNRMYWQNQPFYGFGMGATSYLQGQRLARPRTTQAYYDWVSGFADAETQVVPPSANEVLLDRLMLGLRLAEGVALSDLSAQFGPGIIHQVWQCLRPYVQAGWVEAVDATGRNVSATATLDCLQRLRLSCPEGFLFSNVVLVKLFERFEAPEFTGSG